MKYTIIIAIFVIANNIGYSQSKEQVYDILQYSPSIGFLSSSIIDKNSNFKHDATHFTVSYILMASSVISLKETTHIQRPDGSDFNSFPSGHAAISFMGAELIRTKYKNKAEYWIPSYALASIVSIQRIKDQHHRPLEVISGAIIGIASVHIAQWIENKFRKKKFTN